jgi:hypothetical protein
MKSEKDSITNSKSSEKQETIRTNMQTSNAKKTQKILHANKTEKTSHAKQKQLAKGNLLICIPLEEI